MALPEEELAHLSDLALHPVNFFSVSYDCHYLKEIPTQSMLSSDYQLPAIGFLNGEDQVAKVSGGWSENHLIFTMDSKLPFRNAFFPNFQQGESFELFIDTRDRKDVRINNKFCHHFVFLPQEVDGIQAKEVTKFRTEDSHPHCDPNRLQVFTDHKKKGFSLCCVIPADCLTGYDPDELGRIGFSYRINFTGNKQQHFSVNSSEFSIEQNPALWGTLRLVK